eukprot:SAG11_NODE_218_length_12212_cov_7.026005_11_plen_143_part_00
MCSSLPMVFRNDLRCRFIIGFRCLALTQMHQPYVPVSHKWWFWTGLAIVLNRVSMTPYRRLRVGVLTYDCHVPTSTSTRDRGTVPRYGGTDGTDAAPNVLDLRILWVSSVPAISDPNSVYCVAMGPRSRSQHNTAYRCSGQI